MQNKKERGVVYRITSPCGKVYIGETTKSLISRWFQHCARAYQVQHEGRTLSLLRQEITRYDATGFTVEVLSRHQTRAARKKAEKKLIKKYGLGRDGLNMK